MRYNVRIIRAYAIVGVIMIMCSMVGWALGSVMKTSGVETLGVSMSRTQWLSERAMGINEDEQGWDCRVMGNTTCGAPDNAWYELVCPDLDVTHDTCTLERHPLTVQAFSL